MLYNPISYYPNAIDPLIFYQDIDLDHLDILSNYQNLMSKGHYTNASSYINQQSGVHGLYAGLFNTMENRLYNLQLYLLKKEKKNPFHYSSEEPDINENEFWID